MQCTIDAGTFFSSLAKGSRPPVYARITPRQLYDERKAQSRAAPPCGGRALNGRLRTVISKNSPGFELVLGRDQKPRPVRWADQAPQMKSPGHRRPGRSWMM